MSVGERVFIEGREVGILMGYNKDGTADVATRTVQQYQRSPSGKLKGLMPMSGSSNVIRMSLWNPPGSVMVWDSMEIEP